MAYHNEDIAACDDDRCPKRFTCLRWQLGTNKDAYQTYLDGSVCGEEFYVEITTGRRISTCDEEEWKDIDIYPQYQISSLGNVVRKKDGVILKQYPQKNGYVYVVLDRGRGRHYVPVHRLVCYAFHGSEGYAKGLFVDHINTIRSDNRASNLRWVTPFENANNETTKLNRRKNRNENKLWKESSTSRTRAK